MIRAPAGQKARTEKDVFYPQRLAMPHNAKSYDGSGYLRGWNYVRTHGYPGMATIQSSVAHYTPVYKWLTRDSQHRSEKHDHGASDRDGIDNGGAGLYPIAAHSYGADVCRRRRRLPPRQVHTTCRRRAPTYRLHCKSG